MQLISEPRTAADWMARLRGERATQDDHDAYERWLAADPAHRASAEALGEIWDAAEALEDDPMVREILAESPVRERPRRWTADIRRLAALLVLGVGLVAAWLSWRAFDAVEVYETASGEQQVVGLADGSRLHLNVATRLEVTLRGATRGARLVRGQAFFEIASDPTRPFVVTAGDKEITVLGTKFDVLLQGGDTRVTVIEGRVAVTSLGTIESVVPRATEPSAASPVGDAAEPEPVSEPRAATEQRLELTARDAVHWPRSAPPSSIATGEAIASVEAWLSGKVVFDNTPLSQAVGELDRYTPVRIRLASDELRSTTVSGVFYVDRLANVESLVFALENSLPIVVEQHGDELVLVASG